MSKDVCTHLQYLHNLRDSREILHSLFFALAFLCLGYRSLFYIRHYSSRNPSKPIKNYMFGLFFRVKKITETKILVEFTVLPKRKTYWNWKPIGVHFLVKRHSISWKKGNYEVWKGVYNGSGDLLFCLMAISCVCANDSKISISIASTHPTQCILQFTAHAE